MSASKVAFEFKHFEVEFLKNGAAAGTRCAEESLLTVIVREPQWENVGIITGQTASILSQNAKCQSQFERQVRQHLKVLSPKELNTRSFVYFYIKCNYVNYNDHKRKKFCEATNYL